MTRKAGVYGSEVGGKCHSLLLLSTSFVLYGRCKGGKGYRDQRDGETVQRRVPERRKVDRTSC